MVGERWALLIVRDLEPGPRRFTDLFTGLPGIATDVLADRLRTLESAGAVQQTQLKYPTPAKVYELTERGRELAAITGSLARWGAPLLPASPQQPMRINPRWALQSMVLAYNGGAREGQYAITIDDDDYTITFTGPGAHLSYGPPTDEPLLWARCTAEAFFRLVTTGQPDNVTLDNGSRHQLIEFLRSVPLEIGPGATRPTRIARQRTQPSQ